MKLIAKGCRYALQPIPHVYANITRLVHYEQVPCEDIYDSSVCLQKESQTISFDGIIELLMSTARSNLLIIQTLATLLEH